MSYSKTVADLRNTFLTGKTIPLEWRIKQLNNLMRFYEENSELFVQALNKDLRKSRWEALTTEVNFLKNDVIGCLREVNHWVKPVKADKSVMTLLDDCVIKPEPFGVVLIMGAWNYPLHLTLAPLAGAIAAGNCAIVKPSEISPNTAEAIEKLLTKYVDPDCFRVVNGGIPETTELLKEKFDYIFYTGSTSVGKIIGEAANKHLTPCTLELGGKSPVYIDPDVNLEVAAKRILWGKMVNVGQTCIAPDYVLCNKETEVKFIEYAKKLVKEWFGDNPKASPDLGRIVSDRHFERITNLVSKTKGKIQLGGNHDQTQRYIDLTIITGVDGNDPVMGEEIFGPILPIISVSSAREAVDFINSRDKPLTMYIFSEKKKIQELFMNHTSSGGMAINECLLQLSVESLPFGGVGSSGMGSYHGKASFDTFSHFKSVLIRDCGYIGEKIGAIRYPPYNYKKMPLLEQLLRNRKLPSLGWIGYLLTFLMGAAAAFAATYFGLQR